jgi:alpha-beta hydrolase superfamily lysophospholipase
MRWMAEKGIACHALDLRGQGRSEGSRGFVARWEDYLDDLLSFLSLPQIQSESDGPLFVLGHSHGGLIAAVACIRGLLNQFGVRGVILCSPFLVSRLRRQRWNAALARALNGIAPAMRLPTGLQDEWMTQDPAMIADTRQDELYGRTATPRWYLGQLRAQREAMARAAEFALPLLALAGGADPIADPGGAEQFVARTGSLDKSFRLYPDQLHELLRELRRESTFTDVLTWVRRLT